MPGALLSSSWCPICVTLQCLVLLTQAERIRPASEKGEKAAVSSRHSWCELLQNGRTHAAPDFQGRIFVYLDRPNEFAQRLTIGFVLANTWQNPVASIPFPPVHINRMREIK